MKEKNAVRTKIEYIKNSSSNDIDDRKSYGLITPLRTQLNFKVPESIRKSKDSTIKNDILFYKRAYEEEVVNLNKLINSINLLNKQFFKNNLEKVDNSYQEKDIKNLNDSFKNLYDNIINIKNEITKRFTYFENSSPVFEDFENKEKIGLEMYYIISPLNKINN